MFETLNFDNIILPNIDDLTKAHNHVPPANPNPPTVPPAVPSAVPSAVNPAVHTAESDPDPPAGTTAGTPTNPPAGTPDSTDVPSVNPTADANPTAITPAENSAENPPAKSTNNNNISKIIKNNTLDGNNVINILSYDINDVPKTDELLNLNPNENSLNLTFEKSSIDSKTFDITETDVVNDELWKKVTKHYNPFPAMRALPPLKSASSELYINKIVRSSSYVNKIQIGNILNKIFYKTCDIQCTANSSQLLDILNPHETIQTDALVDASQNNIRIDENVQQLNEMLPTYGGGGGPNPIEVSSLQNSVLQIGWFKMDNDGCVAYESNGKLYNMANFGKRDIDKFKINDMPQNPTNSLHTRILYFAVIHQLLYAFKKITETHDSKNNVYFNHGNLIANNIHIKFHEKYNDLKYPINDTTTIKTNFRVKIANFDYSSILYEKTRYVSNLPKKIYGQKQFEENELKDIDNLYKLFRSNVKQTEIEFKNVFKTVESFKKFIRYNPAPVPFAMEFYVLVISTCLQNKVFFFIFRQFYFDLLFDANLTNANLNALDERVKSSMSYKIYKSIMDAKKSFVPSNIDSINLPIQILIDNKVYFKVNAVDKIFERNIQYLNILISDINNKLTIYNTIKLNSDINGMVIDTNDKSAIPSKLILHVRTNLNNRDVVSAFKKPIELHFNSMCKYDASIMKQYPVSAFLNKTLFDEMVRKFEQSANVYENETSGTINKNILLTIDKKYNAGKKIKLTNGNIYTIIQAKWSPQTWYKSAYKNVDTFEKIKSKSKKQTYEVLKHATLAETPNDENEYINDSEVLKEQNATNEKELTQLNRQTPTIVNYGKPYEYDKTEFSIEINESTTQTMKIYKLKNLTTDILFNKMALEIIKNVMESTNDELNCIIFFIDNNFMKLLHYYKNNWNLNDKYFEPNEGNIIGINVVTYNKTDNFNQVSKNIILQIFESISKIKVNKKYDNHVMTLINNLGVSSVNSYNLMLVMLIKMYKILHNETNKHIQKIKTYFENAKNTENSAKLMIMLYSLHYISKIQEILIYYYTFILYKSVGLIHEIKAINLKNDINILNIPKNITNKIITQIKSKLTFLSYDIMNDFLYHEFNYLLTKTYTTHFPFNNKYLLTGTLQYVNNQIGNGLSDVVGDGNCFFACLLQILKLYDFSQSNNEIENYTKNHMVVEMLGMKQQLISGIGDIVSKLKNSSKNVNELAQQLRECIYDSNYFKMIFTSHVIDKMPNELSTNDYFNNIDITQITVDDLPMNNIYNIIEYMKTSNYFATDETIHVISKLLNISFFCVRMHGNEYICSNIISTDTKLFNPKYYAILYNEVVRDNPLHYQYHTINGKSLLKLSDLPKPLKQLETYQYVNGSSVNDSSVNSKIMQYRGGEPLQTQPLNGATFQSVFNLEREIEEYTSVNSNKKYDAELCKMYANIINVISLQINSSQTSQNKPDDYNLRQKLDIYKQKKQICELKLQEYLKQDEVVYSAIIYLTLYQGENPNLAERQTYRCESNIDELKREYCDLIGIGCDNQDSVKDLNKSKIDEKNEYDTVVHTL